jgi:diguanylate cyclase (GGDEF)-like protein/PAS domain S-box-containing protein
MPERELARRGDEDEDGRDVDDGVRGRLTADVAILGDSLPMGVISAAGMGAAMYVNEAASVLLGRPKEALLDWRWESAIHPDDVPELAAAIALVLDSSSHQRVTVRLADDPDRWLEVKFAALGPRESPTGWIATLDDVSDRVAAERALAHRATHDPLTHLPNRALLVDRLQTAGLRLARRGPDAALALIFCDLDDFKEINDRHGHIAGDEVLVEEAHRLVGAVRASDTVARWGGDEFVAVCELTHPEEVDEVVDRVRHALSRPVHLDGAVVPVHASIGVVVTADAEPDLDQLLATADSRMYETKAERRRARSS